jgi:hypothetical protein
VPAPYEYRAFLINDKDNPNSTMQSDIVKYWLNRFYFDEGEFDRKAKY